MGFFRQYIAPLFIFLIFAVALLAVSARIFLPSDMMAPAPVAEPVLVIQSGWSVAITQPVMTAPAMR